MKDKFVKIRAERYFDLLNSEDELNALHYSGLDNWSGYGEHIEYRTSKEDIEEEVDSKVVD